MLSSLGPPLVLRYLGLFAGTNSLPIAKLPAEPLPASKTYIVVMDNLSVEVLS
jgi:hypothetical protein